MRVKIKSKIFEDDTFILFDGIWVNVNELFQKESLRHRWIQGLIEHELTEGGRFGGVTAHDIKKEFDEFMRKLTFYHNADAHFINQKEIVFKNGYYDEKGWHELANGQDIKFSPFQIARNYKEKVKEGTLMERFLDEYSSKDPRNKQFLLEQVGLCMMPTNQSVALIQFSEGSTTGKGTFVDIIQNIVSSKKQAIISADKFFSPSAGNFILAPTKGRLFTFVDEAPMHIAKKTTELLKEIVDSKKYIPLERKGVDADKVFNSSNLIINTNNHINIHNADRAIMLRLIIYNAKMNSDGNTVFSTQEIDEILKDDDGYDWLVNKATEAIFKAIKRKGKRNQKFTIPDSHWDYWEQLSMNSKSLDIIEDSKILSDLMMVKTDWISNDDIKLQVSAYKNKNQGEQITVGGFKKDLELLLSGKGIANVYDKRTSQGRGIAIDWVEGKSWEDLIGEQREKAEYDKLGVEVYTKLGNYDKKPKQQKVEEVEEVISLEGLGI